LSHIKEIQSAFPHLRYLSNWMEVTTAPAKWDLLKDHPDLVNIRHERAHRIRAATVDFSNSPDGSTAKDCPAAEPTIRRIDTLKGLDEALAEQPGLSKHRLYVIEDLSREVIERLGMKLDIDPLFFREQISDYLWSNVQDPWVELPDLDIVSRNRPFFHQTYVQARFFRDHADFTNAQRDAGKFNVLRRTDDDSAHKAKFDEEGSVVALVRSKFSLWTRPAQDGKGAVAVLLVDPTIKAGFPLWKGYRPFADSPTPSQSLAAGPNNKQALVPAPTMSSLLDNILHWTVRMPQSAVAEIPRDPRVMAYRMLQIYCAEWLTVSRYIQARLGQIEWEIERPDFRHASQNSIGPSLAKLHTWRRRIPLYKGMVTQAHRLLFRTDLDLFPLSQAMDTVAATSATMQGSGSDSQPSLSSSSSLSSTTMLDLRTDYTLLSTNITELLSRTERIAAVATAVTGIEETQRAAEHNLQLGRLTYLAVIFAPLSFVSSFFSMTDDLTSLGTTFWVYFCVAVPISLVVYLLVEKEWKAALRAWWEGVIKRRRADRGRDGGGGAAATDNNRGTHYSRTVGDKFGKSR